MPQHRDRTKTAPRYALPCVEPRQAETKTAPGPSEDCGKRHEKTSATVGDDWTVRGGGAPGRRTSAGTSARAGANANRSSGAGPAGAAANENRATEYCQRGWQRGD